MSSIWNNTPLHGQQGTNHYKVLLKKENAWKTIAAALGGNVSGVFTVEMCMKRWKALQEQGKQKSGDAADNSPPWPYYDLLLFLKDFIIHTKNI